MRMASESKRQNAGNKVPVALPRSDSDSASNLIARDAVFRAVIGARIRVTLAAPNQPSVEGTIFTADPVSNFLVLHTSPSQASSTSPIQPGSYRFIQTSTISSFQLLTLPQPLPAPQSLQLDPLTLDTNALNRRLTTTISKLSAAESRRGPPGTSREAQAIFEALNRSHPMHWHGKEGAMIFSDEYIIEAPYLPENCRVAPGKGGAHGLDRLRKVLKMEREKIALKEDKNRIEGKMLGSGAGGKENRLAVGAQSPRKGG